MKKNLKLESAEWPRRELKSTEKNATGVVNTEKEDMSTDYHYLVIGAASYRYTEKKAGRVVQVEIEKLVFMRI